MRPEASPDAPAPDEQRTFFTMPTGNGHGFQLFDAQASKLIAFLDHPYRYVKAPADPHQNGIERRNLLEELSFGLISKGATSWIQDWPQISNDYTDQTNIVHSVSKDADREAQRYFFSPFGFEENATIAFVRAEPGQKAAMRLAFHLGANPVSPSFWDSTLNIVKIPGESITYHNLDRSYFVVRGKGAGAVLYVPLTADMTAKCTGAKHHHRSEEGWSCQGPDLQLLLKGPTDHEGDFGLMVIYVEDPSRVEETAQHAVDWIRQRKPAKILQDSLAEWRTWRRPPATSFASDEERKVWRQSEASVRMGQVREPNRNGRTSRGMMLAALSPGAWATGWVRDGSYATTAFARTGHFAEAKDSLNFFLRATPVGLYKQYVDNFDYRISVTRYFGTGEEEADYSDQATPNIETDGWGLVLWAARQYVEESKDVAWLNSESDYGRVYDVLRDKIAGAIESQLEPSRIMKPDSSIWEVHQQNAKHFAYTTQAAARGLCDFAALAARAGHRDDHDHFAKLAGEVKAAYLKNFTAPEGYILGATERSTATDLDGSVVEAFNFGLLGYGPLATETLAHLEKLRNQSGGFKRVAGTESYDTDEWAFIDFRMASAYHRLGHLAEAEGLIDRLTTRASMNANLLPEMCNAQASAGPLGAYRGSTPMVGYGSATYLMTLLDRAGVYEDASCD